MPGALEAWPDPSRFFDRCQAGALGVGQVPTASMMLANEGDVRSGMVAFTGSVHCLAVGTIAGARCHADDIGLNGLPGRPCWC